MDLSPEVLVVMTAAMPISELRGAIPLGLGLNLPFWRTVSLALVGNLLPVVPLLYLFSPLHLLAQKFLLTRKFFNWLDMRTRRKAGLVEKYEALGLILFVAIPLPMTGAYTGCVAASIFGINKKLAFLSVLAGVCIAACIVSVLSITTINITRTF